MAKRKKLNVTFHNPNSEEETSKVLIKLFVGSILENMEDNMINIGKEVIMKNKCLAKNK